MKAISVWNPWSHLIINGHKTIETRGWPAPRSIVGQRIAIAATKSLKSEQRFEFGKPGFQKFYRATGLAGLEALPRGVLLGSAVLIRCEKMNEEMIEAVHPRELAFGVWSSDRYAWFLSEPRPLPEPIPVQGAQGLWDYRGEVA